jgi:toxin ParE1/3/4
VNQVFKRAAAKRDLVEHFVYLAEHASLEVADEFLAQAEESFSQLAKYPELGVRLTLRRTQTTGMRKWQVKGFESFLIFYLTRPAGISIVRVLHAAQDWWGLLGLP